MSELANGESPSAGVRRSDFHEEDKFETVDGQYTLAINGMTTIDVRIPDDPGVRSVQLHIFNDGLKLTLNLSYEAARWLIARTQDLINA